ncbi:SDR family NAD(P)-dependent oxidoreductase [Parasphingorhabdus sp.]|uniref:SDR family NAD(P)-dependent oxidoreductase n=1 Tax=Parasphingorhabdus sp. TaxID=2709688 RepID=UPI003D27CC85
MTKLQGKTAIVTGGSRDIGRAVSINLAAEGANVVVNYCNNEADGNVTLEAIKSAGGNAILVQADVTKEEDVQRLVAETTAAFGDTIDILVNVTGGLVARKGLAEMDMEFFNHVMQLNVTSTFMMTQAVAPHMPEGGAILNFASQAGRDGGGPGAAAYGTSKGAVITFTRAMAKELGPRGIRVNSLCPGMIATAFHDTFTKDEVRTAVAAGTPLRRQGNTEEVARTVANLVSDDTSFVTGANIDINGGTLFS